MLDPLRVAKGLPRNCQRAALIVPSDWLGICEGSQDCLRAAVGLLLVLPMACFGIGEGLGLPKGCLGIMGLPMDCFGILQLLPWDCQESPELWPWVLLLGLP